MDIGDKMGLDLQVPMMVSSYFSLGEKKLEKLNEIGLDGQFHRINQLGIVTHSYISHHSEVALGLLKEVSASGHLTDQVKQRFLKIKQENYQECKKGELTSSNRTLIIGLLESGVDTLIEMGQVMVFHYFTQATLMSLMEDVDLNFMRQVQALNAPLVDEVKGLEGRGSVLDSITKKLEIMQTNNSGYSWYKIEETECMKMYEFLAGEALSLEVTQATKVSRHKEHQTYAL